MGVTNLALAGAALDDFHLEHGNFDALIAANGTQAMLMRATRCACWLADTGQPDPGCQLCFPYGYLWAAAESVMVYGPHRANRRDYIVEGTADVAKTFFTLPTGINPAHYSRLLIPLSTRDVDDTLTKGREDLTRFTQVTAVRGAHYTVRVPATGPDYQVVKVPLVVGTDLTVTGRRVTWLNSGIPDGTRYVLQLTVTEEWILLSPQTRVESDDPQPSRFEAQRVDYLLHPRGNATGQAASY